MLPGSLGRRSSKLASVAGDRWRWSGRGGGAWCRPSRCGWPGWRRCCPRRRSPGPRRCARRPPGRCSWAWRVQASKGAPSRRHSKVLPGSSDAGSKLASVAGDGGAEGRGGGRGVDRPGAAGRGGVGVARGVGRAGLEGVLAVRQAGVARRGGAGRRRGRRRGGTRRCCRPRRTPSSKLALSAPVMVALSDRGVGAPWCRPSRCGWPGLASVLPAASVARTWKVCAPSRRGRCSSAGLVQAVKAAPSRLHSKVLPASSDAEAEAGAGRFVGCVVARR